MFWYAESTVNNAESKRIFGYYCPEKSDRNLRFTYSTCKANLIEYCNQEKLEFHARIELTSKAEFKNDYLDYHIFPKRQEKEVYDFV